MGPRTFQQLENFFGIIFLEFVGYLLGGSMVGLMATSSKRIYATRHGSQVCYIQSPCPHSRPLLTCASAGNTQTLKGRSGSVSVESLGPGAHKVLFEASEHLWQVWGLILNAILYSNLGQSLYMDEAKINKPSSKFAAQVYITWAVQLISSC